LRTTEDCQVRRLTPIGLYTYSICIIIIISPNFPAGRSARKVSYSLPRHAFDILALTSDSEEHSLVVLEAMARGLPVVATSVGGISETVRHGVNGFVAPVRGVPEIALRLKRSPSIGHYTSDARSRWRHRPRVPAEAADAGPVFYRQVRYGRNAATFTAWKFRSMVRNASDVLARHLEANPALREEWDRDHKLRLDPRVTAIGRFLRRTSLDELPQIWNVLLGEMSVVGPRPIVAEEIPLYGDAYGLYSQVRPGITGLWQVSGPWERFETAVMKTRKTLRCDRPNSPGWGSRIKVTIPLVSQFSAGPKV
jgi:lipopolysaccharide/colanic/teichoic acid biosynthesis glycosyltransferase